MDCVYCLLGKTKNLTEERKVYIDPVDLMDELDLIDGEKFDTITFSGRGEPTLAANLGDLIQIVRMTRSEKIALITNSTLLYREDVLHDCALADIVCAKLDAYDEQSYKKIDGGRNHNNFKQLVDGLKDFRRIYTGKLSIQIMFIHENQSYMREIADIVAQIKADEVQINTPLRGNGDDFMSLEEVNAIKKCFKGLPVVSVYEVDQKRVESTGEESVLTKRDNFLNSIYK